MNYTELREIERSVGENVKKVRANRKKTQADAAEFLGVSLQQIQKYEKGQNRISAGKLLLLSYHLNVPISSFFDDEAFGVSEEQYEPLFVNSDELQILELYRSINSNDTRKKVFELCKHLEKKYL